MAPNFKRAAVFFFLTTLFFGPAPVMASEAAEYEVKAAFIYNFTKFIEWPARDRQPDNSIDLCILGEDPFGGAIASLEDKISGGRGFKIHRQRRHGDGGTPAACDILFISRSEEKHVLSILGTAPPAGLLTISDMADFTMSGGIIGFRVKNAKIGLSINPAAAERAGLKISSKLLKLADIEGE